MGDYKILEFEEDKSLSYEKQDDYLIKNCNFLHRHAKLVKLLRPIWCENVFVNGLENINSTKKPILFILNHRGYYDILDLLPVWSEISNPPAISIVGRDNYTKIKSLDFLFNSYISPVLSSIKRISTDNLYDSDKEQREHNEKRMIQVQEFMENGSCSAILPEGTSRTNGAINNLKKWGVWRLSHKREKGDVKYIVNLLPVGNTSELMLSKWNRHLTYANVGKEFHYAPSEFFEGETLDEYFKRDMNNFSSIVKNKLIELQTITMSQIGGLYLTKIFNQVGDLFGKDGLSRAINESYNRLNEIADNRSLFLDNNFLNEFETREMFERYFSNLKKQEYISSFDDVLHQININHFFEIPDNSHYKKENPQRYMINGLLDIAKNRPAVKRSLEASLNIPDLNKFEIR
ncbi:hypothetical protein COU53_01925 [Candidatus Pacearchaeota archaeon CG10_big_fil_rev_8_21_14_0_10_30_48]|nr:MAG: hypothetical protein COU53_01925 [Candidatus Pacearchaeota archaeon CG10_big_fil_rev_8_21_14_0_10_30_48]